MTDCTLPAPELPTVAQLWRNFGQRLGAFVRTRVADPGDASDIVQEVFARITQQLAAGREISDASGWVFRITRSAIADHYRGQAKGQRLRERVALEPGLLEVDPAAEFPGETPADSATEAFARCMTAFIATLPKKYAQALELTDLGTLSQVDAARELGLSNSGMKSRVQRGRALLRDRLLQCCRVDLDSRGGIVDFQAHSDDDASPSEPTSDACGCR